jgi:hypothetical protein
MIGTPELTESLESIILAQLDEERYPSQIQVPGLNNEFDPWQRQAKQQLIEELVARRKAHRVRHPGRQDARWFSTGAWSTMSSRIDRRTLVPTPKAKR